MVKLVRWYTSATCARILESLECRGDANPYELVERIFGSLNNIRFCLRSLQAHGVIRICGYLHNTRGNPTPIYRLGPGEDFPIPAPQPSSVRARIRRNRLREEFGTAVTVRVLDRKRFGYATVCVDGKRVNCSSVAPPRAGTISS